MHFSKLLISFHNLKEKAGVVSQEATCGAGNWACNKTFEMSVIYLLLNISVPGTLKQVAHVQDTLYVCCAI